MRTLVENLEFWRAERPDEWTMDELIRSAKELEAEITLIKNTCAGVQMRILAEEREDCAKKYALVPHELMERIEASLRSFIAEEGWSHEDLNLLASVTAIRALDTPLVEIIDGEEYVVL